MKDKKVYVAAIGYILILGGCLGAVNLKGHGYSQAVEACTYATFVGIAVLFGSALAVIFGPNDQSITVRPGRLGVLVALTLVAATLTFGWVYHWYVGAVAWLVIGVVADIAISLAEQKLSYDKVKAWQHVATILFWPVWAPVALADLCDIAARRKFGYR